MCCCWAYLMKENLSYVWKKKGSLFKTIMRQFLSIELVGYLILVDNKKIKCYLVIKKAFVNVFPFIANPERLHCDEKHVPISFGVMPPKKISSSCPSQSNVPHIPEYFWLWFLLKYSWQAALKIYPEEKQCVLPNQTKPNYPFTSGAKCNSTRLMKSHWYRLWRFFIYTQGKAIKWREYLPLRWSNKQYKRRQFVATFPQNRDIGCFFIRVSSQQLHHTTQQWKSGGHSWIGFVGLF